MPSIKAASGAQQAGLSVGGDSGQEPTNVEAILKTLIELLTKMALQNQSGQQSNGASASKCGPQSSTAPVSSSPASGSPTASPASSPATENAPASSTSPSETANAITSPAASSGTGNPTVSPTGTNQVASEKSFAAQPSPTQPLDLGNAAKSVTSERAGGEGTALTNAPSSSNAPRADVMIGSYVDPQNLAAQGELARDPRIGLFSNQIGFVTRLSDQQRSDVLDTFKGKDMTIERASYDDYGPSGNNGLHDQFTQYTKGKTNLSIQTADLDGGANLSDEQSAANVKKMENDIQTQKAAGNTLFPVVGPNTPAGQKQSYAAGFDSPEFDSWRSLAKQAGGLMFDSPPSLMVKLPGYAKFNQDATKWLHENGLKSLWYGASDGHDPDYQAHLEEAVQTMNATNSNPDQYILSGYSDGDPQGTVAAEVQASRYILENTRPV